MPNSELKWYRLDHAAKIYPVLTSERFTYVFRVSANLKDTVDREILYQAIQNSRTRFPSYFVRIRRGFFWYYFEENRDTPFLDHESPYVCRRLNSHLNHGFQFSFYYYETRISLEMNHALSDGAGAIRFLNAVVFEYLKLLGKDVTPDETIMTMNSRVRLEELEDSYAMHCSSEVMDPPKVPTAYFKKQKRLRTPGSGIINSFINTKALLALAKAHDATITQYVIARLIHAQILVGDPRLLKRRPVNVCVPVNLRKAYQSETLSNFSLYFHVSYQTKDIPPDFDEILAKVKADIETENTPKKIQAKLDTVVAIQRKIFVKLIPLAIKYVLFKIGYSFFGRKPTTLTFSNFGKVQVPPSMAEQIDHYSFYMGSGLKTAVAMHSFKDKTSIVFSRAFVNTALEQAFFRALAEAGLAVELTSNYWEYYHKKGHVKTF